MSDETCPDAERMALCGHCAACNEVRPALIEYQRSARGYLKAAAESLRKSGAPGAALKLAQAAPRHRLLSTDRLPVCIAAEIQSFRLAIKARARWINRIALHRQKEDAWRESVPALYQQTSLDLLPFPDASRTVLSFSPDDDPPGVLLYGPTGGGKTRTAFMLLHAWLFAPPWTWSFRYLQGSEIADAANARSRQGEIGEWVNELVDGADAVFIDDVGHGNFSNSYADALRRLVERCTSGHIPLVVTCQYDGRALVRQWSKEEPGKAETAKAIVRRLSEFCRPVSFSQPKR